MSQSEKPKFEQEWQRALESATETPPPSAWEGIEARLDARKSAVVMPLAWWRSPKAYYAAAAVVALSLLSWPVLRLSQPDRIGEVTSENTTPGVNSTEADAPELAVRVPETTPPTIPTEAAPVAKAPIRPMTTEPKTDRLADVSATPELSNVPALEVPSRLKSIDVESQNPHLAPMAASGLAVLPRVSVPDSARPEKVTERQLASDFMPKTDGNNGTMGNGIAPKSGGMSGLAPTIIAITSSSRHSKSEDIERVIMGSSTMPLRTPALTFPIAQRMRVGTSEGAIHLAQRTILYDAAETKFPSLPRRGRVRELWAGISLMPAFFNPKIDVTTAPAAFSDAKASRESLSSGSRGQLSYAVQLQGGKRLSRHWSVETGVSYLQGNSDFKSPGYILDATTSKSQNVLENALTTGKQGNNYFPTIIGTSSSDNSSGAYIALDQNATNNYRYVQVPAQAGYTLNPDGRLSYTLLGGVVANLFLQNQIQDSQGAALKTTADDGIYRGLNWSATTGVRVNYRLAEHWDATLSGSYQKAVASILKDSRTLDSRPQLYGVAWGVRYVF